MDVLGIALVVLAGGISVLAVVKIIHHVVLSIREEVATRAEVSIDMSTPVEVMIVVGNPQDCASEDNCKSGYPVLGEGPAVGTDQSSKIATSA